MKGHCLAKIDSKTILASGGNWDNDGLNPDRAWIYVDSTDNDEGTGWTEVPNMKTGRRFHACGILTDQGDGTRLAVVTGAPDPTELWTVGDNNDGSWFDGPELWPRVEKASGITTNDGERFLLVGGIEYDTAGSYTTKIQSLDCIHRECKWTQMDQELKTAMSDPVVSLLPDSMTECN